MVIKTFFFKALKKQSLGSMIPEIETGWIPKEEKKTPHRGH